MASNTRLIGKMPRAWFSAQAHNTTVDFIIGRDGSSRIAPLGDGERSLGWMVLPPFQRAAVWTEAQKARFIESMYSGLPCGFFVLNRPEGYDHPFDNWLLDGQQRVGAVLGYLAGEFPVYGYRWSEIDPVDRRCFENSNAFGFLETKLTDLDEIREVYDRLAYGGTAHEPKAA